LSFARVPEPSSPLIDLDLPTGPGFFGLIVLRLDESGVSEYSFDILEPARWSRRTISERLSVAISFPLSAGVSGHLPSEFGVCTGRPKSGVELPPRPFE
jgi:hypothetical protein